MNGPWPQDEIHSSHLFCARANQHRFHSIASLLIKHSIKHQFLGKTALEKATAGQKECIGFPSTPTLRYLRRPDGGARCPRQKKPLKQTQQNTATAGYQEIFAGRQSVSVHYSPELRPAAMERDRLRARAARKAGGGLWE